MLVSIIINNYNYGRFVGTAIESALAQTYRDVELIVVDDGSSDDSRDVISRFGAGVKSIFKNNGGQGSAFNAGFAAARGDIVMFLDADDLLLPAAVENMVGLFGPNVVKVHWPLWRIDAEGRRSGQLHPSPRLIEGNLRDLVIRHGPSTYATPPHSPPTSGNAWSRRFLASVLPMAEDVFRWGADTYLLNMAPIFGEIRAAPEPLGEYRVHGSNNTLKPIERFAKEYTRRFEECCAQLSHHLKAFGVDVAPDTWERNSWYHRVLFTLQDIEQAVPEGADFVLIDDATLQTRDNTVAGRRRIPFTEHEGEYWGPPANGAAAVKELDRLARAGTEYVVIAWPSRWYLDAYGEMRSYLEHRYAEALSNERVTIYRRKRAP